MKKIIQKIIVHIKVSIIYFQKRGLKGYLKRIFSKIFINEYYEWCKENEPSKEQLLIQKKHQKKLTNRPLISIITPLYNIPGKVLSQTIGSVLAQTYDNWELCISNGSPENDEINDILHKFVDQYPRIKVKNLEANFGIAGNTNQAISISSGEYIAFLDHDDLLAPFALFELVNAINDFPNADIFYSDEDCVRAKGFKRFNPLFKPAFNLELLRGMNYICHFLVIKNSIGEKIGWLRVGFDGAQDFDLILRAIEKSQSVVHIPKILYHWRALEGSTALDPDSKPESTSKGIVALKDHFSRINVNANIQAHDNPTNYRISYEIKSKPLISIIIPNQNHFDDLSKCINSILKSTYQYFEILIIENNSSSVEIFNYYDELQQKPKIKIETFNENFNFSTICNYGAQKASGEMLLFLNNDMEVITPGWLEYMLEYAQQPQIGAVGAKLYYKDGTIQHAGVFLGERSVIAGHSHKGVKREHTGYMNRLLLPQEFTAVTAACIMIPRNVFEEVNGFDEDFILAFGDVDLCLRIWQKGYKVIWTPYAELYHYESKTRGYEDTPEKKKRFARESDLMLKKWDALYEMGDLFYNPNLIARGDFWFRYTSKSVHSQPRRVETQKL